LMPYGIVDTADLKMAQCDFEKDANAEVLFDQGVFGLQNGFPTMARHRRIKILNDFGKSEANIRLVYYSNPAAHIVDGVTGLHAETINLDGGKVKITQVDKSQIYIQKVDDNFTALTFTFPDVKAGSVIEYEYQSREPQVWYFQDNIPTRYSELETDLLERQQRKDTSFITQPYAKEIGSAAENIQVKALQNIHSAPREAYMVPMRDRLQRIEFYSSDLKDNSWQKIIGDLLNMHRFANELYGSVSGEDRIIAHAKKLATKDEKIAFLFDTVRNRMKWNGSITFTSVMGKATAWNNGSGNSAEINLTLYHLLQKSGITAFPLMVGTPVNQKIDPDHPNRFSVNGVIIYVPIDNSKYYVLDASNKFGLFNIISSLYLNSYGILVDPDHQTFDFVMLKPAGPALKTMFADATVAPQGAVTGTAEINSFSYNKLISEWAYKSSGVDKLTDSLQRMTDNLKISSLKIENLACDTLPFTQKIGFSLELQASGDSYLYLNPNIFSLPGRNPFTNEDRLSDIDFRFNNNLSINITFHVADKYITESLPKTITILMPDQSIMFKRFTAQENGVILIRYTIIHKSEYYPAKEYQNLRGFYKKMYELLNEPVVLKKS
jgi:hypothetical protein